MESKHKVVSDFKKSDLSPNSKILCPSEYKLVELSLNTYPDLRNRSGLGGVKLSLYWE